MLAAVVGTVASEAADAFAIANQLPNNVFWLISSGVFSAVLIPELVRSTRDADGGAAFLNKLLTLGLVIITAVAVAAVAISPWLVSIYVHDWPPAQFNLAVIFAFWCLPQILFYGAFSLFGEALNSRGRYAPAAWAPLANNVISLAGLGVFAAVFGVFPTATGRVDAWTSPMIALLAGSATLAVAGQALVVAIAMRKAGLHFRLDFRWKGVSLGTASRAARWTFGLVLIGQLLGVVQTQVASIASGQGASTFASTTAWLLFMLPYSVIAVSIGTVYFTRFSEHGASGDTRALAADIALPLRTLLVTMLGAGGAMILIALPISRFFTDSADAAVSLAFVLLAYLVALVPTSLLFLFQRAFYAMGDARTPFAYTCVQATLILAGTLALPALVPVTMLAAAVALVQSLAAIIQTALAAWLLRRRIGPIGVRTALGSLWRSALAILIAGGICAPLIWTLLGANIDGYAMHGRLEGLTTAAAIGIVFAGLFGVVMFWLRDPILRRLYRDLRPRH